MAIPWLVVLQSVPWTDVIRNAPKVADGAKKLWSTVSKKAPAQKMPSEEVEAPLASESQSIAILQKHVASMEAAITDLHSQMLASSELIKTLAEQNTQLIERVEVNRIRVMWLGRAIGVLGILIVTGITFVIMR